MRFFGFWGKFPAVEYTQEGGEEDMLTDIYQSYHGDSNNQERVGIAR